MVKRVLFVYFALLMPVISFALTTKQLAVSINLAGKQRMLTQKMTKEALLIKAGVEKEQNLKKLEATSTLFDRTLKGLIKGDEGLKLKPCQNAEVQKQLGVVQQLWKPFRQNIMRVIQGKADARTYQMLQDKNLELLKEMNRAVQLYVAQSKEGTSRRAQAINLSGKERMLTQRMAKDLLLISQNLNPEQNREDLKKTMQLFERILRGLQKGDKELSLEGTKLPKIQKQLHKGEKLWRELKPNLLKKSLDKRALKTTIEKLDTLLAEMDKAVKLFEKSIKKEKQALQLSSIVSQYMEKKNLQNHIINLSGKQRMLTQKISKLSLLVALGIDQKKNRVRLVDAAKLYDKTLSGFLNGDPSLGLPATKNRKIASYIKELQKVWSPFKTSAQNVAKNGKQDLKSIGYIIKNNENLLKMSNELVQMFKHSFPKQTFLEKARANIVDIAGRQRMLTQKMTKEKLLVLLDLQADENRKRLKQTVALFDTTLQALIHGDPKRNIIKPSNQKIKKQLQKVAAIWKGLKPLYLKEVLSKSELNRIVRENPVLLAQMHKAVTLSASVAEY
ncbi:MAG: hypothetical protein B6D59_01880 [Campylobacteraceae bacterium 4484_4]|nr:MAG: hypothetical protein B6D59_01880 [Campylobacteraceae bacterium 4484_4]